MKHTFPLTALAVALLVAGCASDKKPQPVVPQQQPVAIADTLPPDDAPDDDDDADDDDLMVRQPMPKAADELFDDFIFNFASSRRLQLERIDFPLIVSCDTTLQGDSTQYALTADDWQTQHFFMHEGEYTLLFDSPTDMELVKDTSVSSVTLEQILPAQDLVKQYTFGRTNGQWRLQHLVHQPLADNRNAQFIAFYHQFATDSAFQRESLSAAIDFVAPDPDDDFGQTEGVITPDFWDAFVPEMPAEIAYNIVYGQPTAPTGEKIFVVRGISNGLELELRFRQSDGRWLLTKISE